MIWVVKQFITHQILEIEGERVRFPIRVEVEYQQDGEEILKESFHEKILYNKAYLLKRYSHLREDDLDRFVKKRVRESIEEQIIHPKESLAPQGTS